jgi:hypothetical protein
MTNTEVDPNTSQLAAVRTLLSGAEWARVAAMVGVIVALHLFGWVTLAAFVAPQHFSLGGKSPRSGRTRRRFTNMHLSDVGSELLYRSGTPSPQLLGLESGPQGSAFLVVKRGPNAGSRFLLDQATTTAGRHPNSDIFLDDITVSRRHAQFRCVSGEFKVVDLGSLNGTYVNREPVDSAVLANGDEVQIGKFRLVFLTGPTTGDTESVTGDPVTSASTKPEIGSSPTRYLYQHHPNVANM